MGVSNRFGVVAVAMVCSASSVLSVGVLESSAQTASACSGAVFWESDLNSSLEQRVTAVAGSSNGGLVANAQIFEDDTGFFVEGPGVLAAGTSPVDSTPIYTAPSETVTSGSGSTFETDFVIDEMAVLSLIHI